MAGGGNFMSPSLSPWRVSAEGGQGFIAKGREVLQEQVFPHTIALYPKKVKELRLRVRQFQKHRGIKNEMKATPVPRPRGF